MLFAQYANFKKNQNSVQFKAKNEIFLKCGLRRYEREKSCEIEARQISSLSLSIIIIAIILLSSKIGSTALFQLVNMYNNSILRKQKTHWCVKCEW